MIFPDFNEVRRIQKIFPDLCCGVVCVFVLFLFCVVFCCLLVVVLCVVCCCCLLLLLLLCCVRSVFVLSTLS